MAKGKGPKMRGLGGGPSPSNMMQQLQKLQEELVKTREALANEYVTVSVGGNAVTVTMSGQQECRSVEISPQLLADGDVAMLQDLVVTAVNQAIEASQTLAAERLGPLTGGLGLPGM